MLAPGDYLIQPPPAAPAATAPAGTPTTERTRDTSQTAPAPVRAEDPEPRSFLLTLLRALGAVHT